MSKRIFITGAAGFIGFHLAQALANRGDHVLGYDNFNDYYPSTLKRERAQLLKQSNVTIIDGDILDRSTLDKSISQHQTTHVVHLAAQAGVRYSLTHPHLYIKTNVDGFVNILEACRLAPGIKLVYASSSSVYGLNSKVPFSVSDRTDHQASLYGVTKKTNELMAATYHHLYQIPVTGLRFFTVYGPWGRPDMAYFSFTKAILEEKSIDLFHYGEMQRDFTYIDDIIQGIIAAVDKQESSCELYNLGNHQPVALRDFVAILEKKIGKRAIIRELPMQPGDVFTTYADITESTERLGYIPRVPIEIGLPRFVDWYLQWKK